jgi:hypothetical protein
VHTGTHRPSSPAEVKIELSYDHFLWRDEELWWICTRCSQVSLEWKLQDYDWGTRVSDWCGSGGPLAVRLRLGSHDAEEHATQDPQARLAFYFCSKFSWVFPRYITVQYGASSIIIHEWTETTSAILGAATEVVCHQTVISVWVSNTTLHRSSTGILTLIKLIRQIKYPKFTVMISWSVIEVLFKIQGELLRQVH